MHNGKLYGCWFINNANFKFYTSPLYKFAQFENFCFPSKKIAWEKCISVILKPAELWYSKKLNVCSFAVPLNRHFLAKVGTSYNLMTEILWSKIQCKQIFQNNVPKKKKIKFKIKTYIYLFTILILYKKNNNSLSITLDFIAKHVKMLHWYIL